MTPAVSQVNKWHLFASKSTEAPNDSKWVPHYDDKFEALLICLFGNEVQISITGL